MTYTGKFSQIANNIRELLDLSETITDEMKILHATRKVRSGQTICGKDLGEGSLACYTPEQFVLLDIHNAENIRKCKSCAKSADVRLSALATIGEERFLLIRCMIQNKCMYCGAYRACKCEKDK